MQRSLFFRFPNILAVAFAFFGALAVQAETRVWTGGSGNWTDSANWLNGAVPSAGDTVYVSNTVDAATINIDVPNVSLYSIRFEGRGTVTLTGEELTLTGGWSFPNLDKEAVNVKNYHAGIFSWLAYGANVDCRIPLTFWPSNKGGLYNCGICTATNIVHFREKVTVKTTTRLYLHNGLQPSSAETSAGITGQKLVPVYFHGEVEGKMASIQPTQSPTGPVYFYNSVKLAELRNSGWTSCVMYLYSPSNSWNNLFVDYGNIVVPLTADVIPSNTVLKLGEAYSSSNGRFNLRNTDITIDRIEGSDKGIDNYVSQSAGGYITSASDDNGKGQRHPATLTMKATADAVSTFIVENFVSLVWDPVGDFTFTATNRTSTTSGSIFVKRGNFRLTGNAAFPNVRDVDVAAGARFSIETSSETPVSEKTFLRLGQGAKLFLASGVSVTMGLVGIDGVFVADGTYRATGENAVDWIEGDGELIVSNPGICVWKNAADGSWFESANWYGGRVPSGTENDVYIYNDSAEDFTVSIPSPISAFPTNFHIRNLGGGSTTLSCAADVTASCASIDISHGARVKVEDGVTFFHSTIEPTDYDQLHYKVKYDPACVVSIANGGEWLTSGSTVFTNFYGSFVVKGHEGAEGCFNMRGGRFLFSDLTSSWPIRIYRNGIVDLRDGDFMLPHHGYNHNSDIKLIGGVLYLSNTVFSTVGKFITSNGGSIIFGTGETVFDGLSEFLLGTGNWCLKPDAEGQTATFTMKGESKFSNDSMASAYWLLGGTPKSKAVFNYEAGDSVKQRPFFVGDTAGEAELNVKTGLLRVHSVGLCVAGKYGKHSPSETNVTGRVRVEEGAAMYIRGSLDAGWGANKIFCGMVVGYGNTTESGQTFDGGMEVFGTVTNEFGHVVIGWGKSKGTYVQQGGSTYLLQKRTYSYSPITAVGVDGGSGSVIVSNGIFSVNQGRMFIGGCPDKSEIKSYNNKTIEEVPWTPDNAPVNNHDAKGTITVVNGDFSAAGEVIVGADGYGIIEMIGKDGSFTAGNMVLSNAASSVVRFVSGANGFSPINVTNLTVTDGTRIEVDLSDYAGSANKHRLFNAASLNGDFDDVEIVVRDSNGVVSSPYMFKKSETAVDLYFIIGTTIIIR